MRDRSTQPADSIADVRRSILDGTVRPSELVERALRAIGADDSRLRAWVVVDAAGARRQALELETGIAAGRTVGPLAGATLGIKDIFDVVGLPTRAGSNLTSAAPAVADAPVIARLRSAGAIILGKTVTTQFACFDPPPTRNPLNFDCTPGGSSSGSAAAVAAGHCLAALGSQTGGSILRPAAYCGIYGFKPSFDAVSRAGVVPVTEHLDHVGPMATSVADLIALWQVIADPEFLRIANPSATAPLGQGAPRFGVLDALLDQASTEVAAAVRSAIDVMRSAGAAISSVALPADFDQVWSRHRTVMNFELAQVHRQAYAAPDDAYSPSVRSLLVEGRAIDEQTYRAALAHRQQFRQQMAAALSGWDGWLMPSAGAAAPPPDSTGDPRFNSPWSYAGFPAVTLPCGLAPSNRTGIGLQIVASAGQDTRLLSRAAWCEHALRSARSSPGRAAVEN